MKKLFTLVALALVAMSASAKEVLTLPEDMGPGKVTAFGSWEWRDVAKLYSGAEIAEDATDEGVIYYDASAFDYLVIKYKQCSVKTNFGVQFNSKGTVGQWGPELYQSQEVIAANTSGVLGVKLDADHKNKVYKVYLQPQGEGSLIIEEVYFGSEAEYQADLAANPVVDWYPETKELSVASATNTWNDASYTEFDPATGKVTIVKNNGAQGWWLGNDADFAYYDYFVLELADVQKAGYLQLNVGTCSEFTDGSYVKLVTLPAKDANEKRLISQIMIQGGEGTTFTIKKAYFATAEYVRDNGIHDEVVYGDTQELSLANLGAGWNSEYDAATATISVTGEEGGKGWWVKPADYSHFDNFVVEFETTTSAGKVVVEYVDPDELQQAPALAPKAEAPASTETVFGVGATCVVVPLDATGKSAVQQLYVMGTQDATFKLKKAYVAVASATPEAQLGTGINALTINNDVNAPMYNLAGQRVDAQFKGVVIQNGRKFMNK